MGGTRGNEWEKLIAVRVERCGKVEDIIEMTNQFRVLLEAMKVLDKENLEIINYFVNRIRRIIRCVDTDTLIVRFLEKDKQDKVNRAKVLLNRFMVDNRSWVDINTLVLAFDGDKDRERSALNQIYLKNLKNVKENEYKDEIGAYTYVIGS